MCNERDGGRSLSFHSVPYGPSFILAVSRNERPPSTVSPYVLPAPMDMEDFTIKLMYTDDTGIMRVVCPSLCHFVLLPQTIETDGRKPPASPVTTTPTLHTPSPSTP